MGCRSYTIQPSTNNCPTAAPVIPTGSGDSPICSTDTNTPTGAPVIPTGSEDSPSSTDTNTPTAAPVIPTGSGDSPICSTYTNMPKGEPVTNTPNVPTATFPPTATQVIPTGSGDSSVGSVDTNTPTAAPITPTGSENSPTGPTDTNAPTSLPVSPPPPLPSGGVAVTGTIDMQAVTETYIPTVYSQFTIVTAIITTTVVDSQGSTSTVVVGPSGEAWIPFNKLSGIADIPAPSALPSAPGQTSASASEGSPSPPSVVSGETVLTSIVGAQTVVETFVPTFVPEFNSLTSTITTTTLNAQQSPETVVIGPGGIAWAPLSQEPSGVPELSPPTILPVNANAPSIIPPSIPSTITSLPSITSIDSNPISSNGGSAEPQSSVTTAFDTASQSETTLTVNGVTLPYAKATFSDLATITAPITVTTPV